MVDSEKLLMYALEKTLNNELDIISVEFKDLDEYLKNDIRKDGILLYETRQNSIRKDA